MVHTCQPSCNPLHLFFRYTHVHGVSICRVVAYHYITISTLLPATYVCQFCYPCILPSTFHLRDKLWSGGCQSEMLKSPNLTLFHEPLSCVHDHAVVFHQFCCCLANHSHVHDQCFSIVWLTGSFFCAIISSIAPSSAPCSYAVGCSLVAPSPTWPLSDPSLCSWLPITWSTTSFPPQYMSFVVTAFLIIFECANYSKIIN